MYCVVLLECTSGPCANGGTCVDGINSFTCLCRAGYSGAQCTTDINECASTPCQNGGTCVDAVNSFSCQCVAGWTGKLCQTNINECASQPCRSQGTCIDRLNGFECVCAAGYSGVQCQTDVNECVSDPCQNGGTCSDQIDSFTCACTGTHYVGTTCETDINECAVANGGCAALSKCVNLPGSYYCAAYIVPASFVPVSSAAVESLSPLVLRSTNTIDQPVMVQMSIVPGTQSTGSIQITAGWAHAPFNYGGCDYIPVGPCGSAFPVGCVNVTCSIQPGCGTGIRYYLSDTSQIPVAIVSNSTETYSFPVPTVVAGTIRSNSSNLVATNNLQPGTTNSVVIQMTGTNFCPNSDVDKMYATYGLLSQIDQYLCVAQPLVNPSLAFTTFSCRTADYSSGQFLRFMLHINGQSVGPTADTITYPSLPVIYKVSGCSDSGNTTTSCSTEGNTLLHLYGLNFVAPLTVYIGGNRCVDESVIDPEATHATCTLPVGTGSLRAVTVSITGANSAPVYFVSYAVPSITKLETSNCEYDTNATQPLQSVVNCPTTGMTSLTIDGVNFGARGARVLIGTSLCSSVIQDVTQPHRRLVCTTATGTAPKLNILMLQDGGELAVTNATLGYRQCLPGTKLKGLECENCTAGLYSSTIGASECIPCAGGKASGPAPSQDCTTCLEGSVSRGGTSSCSQCMAGSYMSAKGQVEWYVYNTCRLTPSHAFCCVVTVVCVVARCVNRERTHH